MKPLPAWRCLPKQPHYGHRRIHLCHFALQMRSLNFFTAGEISNLTKTYQNTYQNQWMPKNCRTLQTVWKRFGIHPVPLEW